MVGPFVYNASSVRVVFGSGTLASLADEIDRLGATKALILTTAQQSAEGTCLAERLGGRMAGVYSGAVMHTPSDVTDAALDVLKRSGANCVISFGGGSTIGLGKALALRTGVLQIAVPTTYAGSEMTPILGETKNGVKTTVRTVDVLPETVIYDVELTLTLPVSLTGISGINAIAHAVEALYASDRNPVTSLMACEGIRKLSRALPRLADSPLDRVARTKALYGAWLCGSCLGAVGMALHHKLCHTLGGSFDLPHAETHAVVLPHVVGYNTAAAPEAMACIAAALGEVDSAQGLFNLASRVGAKQALKFLGMPESEIDRAACIAAENAYWNPRPIDRSAIRDLIANAWAGNRPTVMGHML